MTNDSALTLKRRSNMKSLLSFCCLIALTVLSASRANADIAKPKPPTNQQTKIVLRTNLEIVPDARTYQARLQISQSDLQNLRAAIDGTPGNATIAANIASTPTRTIIAGLLLFLSISFAGVWLARLRPSFGRRQKGLLAVILVIASLGVAAIITRGNAAPPTGFLSWKNLPQNLSQGRASSGDLEIELVPDDPNRSTGMKLIIPLRKQKQSGEDE
jgi:hypothetical protein